VDDSLGMAIVNSLQKLVQHLLDLNLAHRSFILSHIFFQVVLDKFKNQIKFLLVGLEDNLLQTLKMS